MTELHSSLVEQAMRFAAVAHRNQRRKASSVPYISHPTSVAMILMRSGFDVPEVLAAALLHDVVEDTEASIEDLRREFPESVCTWVDAVSERKADTVGHKRSWNVRKTEHIALIAEAAFEARAILLADKLHNLATMCFDIENGEDIWRRFGASAADLVWYHREITSAAFNGEANLRDLFEDCQRMIGDLQARVSQQQAAGTA